MLEKYAERYKLEYYILNCLGEVDCWEECGRFILFPENDREKKIFNKTNYDYAKQYLHFEKQHNINVLFLGMRKKKAAKEK